jgi:chromosome segregation ATPase
MFSAEQRKIIKALAGLDTVLDGIEQAGGLENTINELQAKAQAARVEYLSELNNLAQVRSDNANEAEKAGLVIEQANKDATTIIADAKAACEAMLLIAESESASVQFNAQDKVDAANTALADKQAQLDTINEQVASAQASLDAIRQAIANATANIGV